METNPICTISFFKQADDGSEEKVFEFRRRRSYFTSISISLGNGFHGAWIEAQTKQRDIRLDEDFPSEKAVELVLNFPCNRDRDGYTRMDRVDLTVTYLDSISCFVDYLQPPDTNEGKLLKELRRTANIIKNFVANPAQHIRKILRDEPFEFVSRMGLRFLERIIDCLRQRGTEIFGAMMYRTRDVVQEVVARWCIYQCQLGINRAIICQGFQLLNPDERETLPLRLQNELWANDVLSHAPGTANFTLRGVTDFISPPGPGVKMELVDGGRVFFVDMDDGQPTQAILTEFARSTNIQGGASRSFQAEPNLEPCFDIPLLQHYLACRDRTPLVPSRYPEVHLFEAQVDRRNTLTFFSQIVTSDERENAWYFDTFVWLGQGPTRDIAVLGRHQFLGRYRLLAQLNTDCWRQMYRAVTFQEKLFVAGRDRSNQFVLLVEQMNCRTNIVERHRYPWKMPIQRVTNLQVNAGYIIVAFSEQVPGRHNIQQERACFAVINRNKLTRVHLMVTRAKIQGICLYGHYLFFVSSTVSNRRVYCESLNLKRRRFGEKVHDRARIKERTRMCLYGGRIYSQRGDASRRVDVIDIVSADPGTLVNEHQASITPRS